MKSGLKLEIRGVEAEAYLDDNPQLLERLLTAGKVVNERTVGRVLDLPAAGQERERQRSAAALGKLQGSMQSGLPQQ